MALRKVACLAPERAHELAAATDTFADVGQMLRRLRPAEPVYCIYPKRYRASTASFVSGFPGRVLYAVKANDDPRILRLLYESGIRHFDCASLPEIARVAGLFPDASCYFMIPVRLRGAAVRVVRPSRSRPEPSTHRSQAISTS